MKNKLKKKRLVLGITGSFGSGKTTVAGIFGRLGASVIDADRIYHQLIRPESSVYRKIVSAFGQEILGKKKQIDRKKIRKIVFNNRHRQALKRLCQITHPAIIRQMNLELSRLKRSKRYRVIVIDAPLLIEAGLIKITDKLIVVKASKKNQITRCQKQWKVPQSEIIMRIRTQMSLTEKIKIADFVIDNNGTLQQTRKQVKEIWKNLK